jgi:ubiquinone/menaquinone biosynthesis C-methylase UbiE
MADAGRTIPGYRNRNGLDRQASRRRGAVVTGIDIGEGVIEAAKRLGPGITFQVGDAEALEFDEATFDGVMSTFGVMFVARPAAAAGEIARVTRRGGRLALVTWLPGGPVEDLFKLTRTFMPAPPSRTATISL